MATEIEYMERIRTYDLEGLKALWLQKKRRQVETEFWKQGKLLEYIVLRALSLVDMTIRLMIADDTIKKHALLTLNVGDFNDVCLMKNVEMITR